MMTNTFKPAGKDNNAIKAQNPYLDDALLMDIAKGVQHDQIKVNELKRNSVKNELNNDNKINEIIKKVKQNIDHNNENKNINTNNINKTHNMNANNNTSLNDIKTLHVTNNDDEKNDDNDVYFKIGTRKSNLAMYQANLVRDLMVQHLDHSKTYEVIGIKTSGDKDKTTPLSHFSDKGIFTKELDVALLNNEIDCAVHCVKDLPTKLPIGLEIGCFLKREIPNDCCLVNKNKYGNIQSMKELPKNSIIGTSSLRRKALLHYNYKKSNEFIIKDIRGNLDTRLNKLMNGDYDAILLAKVGVKRLKWINNPNLTIIDLDSKIFPYAVGQAGLGIVINDKNMDIKSMLYNNKINDITCEIQCIMERTLLSILEGGCKVPIGCVSNIYRKCPGCGLLGGWQNLKCEACLNILSDVITNNVTNNINIYLYLYSCVLTQDGSNKIEYKKMLKCSYNGINNINNLRENAKEIGTNVANELKNKGAMQIINNIKSSLEQH